MILSIIVPCYNEVDNASKLSNELVPVIQELIFEGLSNSPRIFESAELIFVDDGSTDGTLPNLKKRFSTGGVENIKYKFLEHKRNLGLGAAIRTGFSNAGGDILVTVDSDGTYEFSEIPALLSQLSPQIDVVTASPYHPNGNVIGVPSSRLFLSKASSFLYRILVDWNLHTYTCLFRAYRSEVVKKINFKSNGFLAGTEILVKAKFHGFQVAEYPAVLHKRMHGVSKAKIAETSFAHLKFQALVILYRIKMLFSKILS